MTNRQKPLLPRLSIPAAPATDGPAAGDLVEAGVDDVRVCVAQ